MTSHMMWRLWVVTAAVSGLAQVPTPAGESKAVPVSKIERKNRAPVSKEILRVKLPRPVEATLDNGLTVLIMEDHRLPTISLQLLISGAGGLYDPKELPGLASLTAEMLREGTKTRSSRQIAEEIERLGAGLNAAAGFGSPEAVMTASGLSDNFEAWFGLFTDVLLNPSFPAEELKNLKDRRRVQLRQQRASPSFLAQERFARAVYGDHPAAVIAPTLESLDRIRPEDLARWHRERWAPQNAILAIAGDVRAKELIPKLNQWLAGWKRTELRETLPAHPKPAPERRIYLVNRPNSVQTTVAMGNIAIDRRSPDYIPMVVMNRIVGGGPAARLFLNLREEKGYTYGVYSFFSAAKYPGPWRAGGDMRTEVTEGAMTEFLNEIRRIREELVPEAELEEAKRAVVASFALSLERPEEVLSYAITRKLYGFPEDYWDTYPAKIMAVTAADVQAVARKYIQPEALQIVAVGDGAKIRGVLEKYGPVEVYDTEGRPST
ncbi:MAG: pitrilysin family protein [Bryobacterales bacterium]|nr:insulinase family protein [Bryobacteraceae bacterium]MDW8354107.1 pitrilysin family protein [Bryobacterales bacterium]